MQYRTKKCKHEKVQTTVYTQQPALYRAPVLQYSTGSSTVQPVEKNNLTHQQPECLPVIIVASGR